MPTLMRSFAPSTRPSDLAVLLAAKADFAASIARPVALTVLRKSLRSRESFADMEKLLGGVGAYYLANNGGESNHGWPNRPDRSNQGRHPRGHRQFSGDVR